MLALGAIDVDGSFPPRPVLPSVFLFKNAAAAVIDSVPSSLFFHLFGMSHPSTHSPSFSLL